MSTQQLTTARSRVQPTGFELAPPQRSDATNIADAIERNRGFAAAGGHQGAVVFPRLHLFVITCLDPRTDPAHFLGLNLSDALVVRNAGGRVTQEVINDIAFIGQITENALPDGPLFEVAVIHHNQCGTGALADDTFRHRYAERIGADETRLRQHAVLNPVATVTHDVERIRSAPGVSPRITVSGHVYDVLTGLVETVIPAGHFGNATPNQPHARTIGPYPYDDPTQGRTIGSHPYDDPTQGRTVGSHPHDDPTRGH